jgi:hypothetical protein
MSALEQIRLQHRIKSRLARQMWRNEGLFAVLNQEDPMILMALGNTGK